MNVKIVRQAFMPSKVCARKWKFINEHVKQKAAYASVPFALHLNSINKQYANWQLSGLNTLSVFVRRKMACTCVHCLSSYVLFNIIFRKLNSNWNEYETCARLM